VTINQQRTASNGTFMSKVEKNLII